MGEFRIGRSHAKHSYPDTNRGAGPLAYARNSASNDTEGGVSIPATPTTIPMEWLTIESGGGGAGVTTVPVTPKVTGTIRVIARASVEATGLAAPVLVQARLLFDGVAVATTIVTIPVDTAVSASDVTLMVDLTGKPIGTQIAVSMDFTALTGFDGAHPPAAGHAAIDIQELQFASV